MKSIFCRIIQEKYFTGNLLFQHPGDDFSTFFNSCFYSVHCSVDVFLEISRRGRTLREYFHLSILNKLPSDRFAAVRGHPITFCNRCRSCRKTHNLPYSGSRTGLTGRSRHNSPHFQKKVGKPQSRRLQFCQRTSILNIHMRLIRWGISP